MSKCSICGYFIGHGPGCPPPHSVSANAITTIDFERDKLAAENASLKAENAELIEKYGGLMQSLLDDDQSAAISQILGTKKIEAKLAIAVRQLKFSTSCDLCGDDVREALEEIIDNV